MPIQRNDGRGKPLTYKRNGGERGMSIETVLLLLIISWLWYNIGRNKA